MHNPQLMEDTPPSPVAVSPASPLLCSPWSLGSICFCVFLTRQPIQDLDICIL